MSNALRGARDDPTDDPVERARVRWPALCASAELRALVESKLRALPEEACDPERRDELVLACACAERQPGALMAFEREYLAQVPRWLSRGRPASAFLDELLQSLRERLFVGDGRQAPRISAYLGKGPLGAWLRVLATRLAIDLRRRAAVRTAGSIERLPVAVAPSSEGAYVKARYLGAVQEAIDGAARTLTAQQRLLLRAHFVDGATFDELAARYRIHKATVWRRISAARAAVVEAARRALRDSTTVAPADFDSILRAVHSQLDLSLSRFC